MMQLSNNFSLKEFIHSDTAIRLCIKNEPDATEIGNLIFLTKKCLQPIRDYFNSPVVVNSGYRSEKLNRAIGGSKTSQHMSGEAADIQIPGVNIKELFYWCRNNLTFDQLILEFDSWVHISYSRQKNRNQALIATKQNGKTVYTESK